MLLTEIARVAHEVNRAYCASLGDNSQPSWKDAPQWQRDSCNNGVYFHMKNPHASPAQSHEEWLKHKQAEGWTFGPVKDPQAKRHPCCVPFEDLPQEQRTKDFLFRAVCRTLLDNTIGAMAPDYAEVIDALEESVKLQSTYAGLLNLHDGGERMKFYSAAHWMKRLAEIKVEEAGFQR